MPGECEDKDGEAGNDSGSVAAIPPEKMSRTFYLALALLGILVVMVLIIKYPGEKVVAGNTMMETNWTLQSQVDTTGILVPAMSGNAVTAHFGRDGRLTGNAGCNQYVATYTVQGYQLAVSDIGETRMFCTGEGVMEQESAFLADLGRAASFRISGSFLKIYDADGRPVLIFGP